MAKDDTPITGFNEGAKAADSYKSSVEAATQQTKAFQGTVNPTVANLRNFTDASAEAARQQETLGEAIRRHNAQLADQVRQLGSLQSVYGQLAGAAGGFLGSMQRMISIGGIYNQLLDEMRTSQKAFTSSLSASTSELGKATAQADRVLEAHRLTMVEARKTAGELNIAYEELQNISKTLVGRFASQLLATKREVSANKELQKTVVNFSRFMGTDYNETIGLIDSRMQSSTKTLEEVQKELLVVAMEADKWTASLKAMGDRAQQTGNVTRTQFLAVIQGIKQEFKGGMYAAEGFAKSTRLLLKAGKEAGLTPEEQQAMAGGWGKIISQMGSFNSIFGARTAQYFGSLLGDLSQIQDEALRKRFEPYAKRFMETGQLNVVDLQAIVGASRGSAEGIKHLIRIMQSSGVNRDVMRSVFAEALGPGQQHIADKLVEFMETGQAEKAFKELEISTANAKTAEAKKSKDELDLFKTKFEELIKAGHTTGSLAHAAAAKAYELQQKIYAWLQKSPVLFALAMMGANALGGLLARGLGGLLRAGVGRLGASLAAGGGRFAGLGARMATWATPAAAAAAPMATTVAGSSAAAGGAAAGGGLLASGAGAAALGAAGVALAGYVGLKAGSYIDKKLGEAIASRVSTSRAVAMGKDVSLSGALGTLALPKEMIEQMVRIRGILTDNHKKEYEQNKKAIESAKANWNNLSSVQKEQVRQLEQSNGRLGRWINKMSLTDKQKLAYDKDFRANQQKDMKAAMAGLDWDKITALQGEGKDEEARKEAVRMFVGQAGMRFRRGTAGAVDQFVKSEEGQAFLERAGIGAEQFKESAIKEVARLKFVEATDVSKMAANQAAMYEANIKEWMKSAEGKAASPEMVGEAQRYIAQLQERQSQLRMQELNIKVEGGETPAETTTSFDSADNKISKTKTAVGVTVVTVENQRPIAQQLNKINERNKPKGVTR